jgi:4'-phosphopantetheinyl transferase
MKERTDAPLRLEEGTVDVWLTSMATLDDERRAGYESLLSETEHERWRRFLVRGAADQYLVGRALLRTTLSRYAPVSERAWVFDANAYGRPHVAAPAAFRTLRFNLSHTDGLVACAVTANGEVGIDVEIMARAVDPLELAPTVFARAEIEAVAAAAPEIRHELFLTYWTLKEAYVKARGMGVSLALDGFWFELSGPAPRIHFSARCPDRAERWHFGRWRPTPEHALALAVAMPSLRPPSIRLRWIVPGAAAAG